MVASVMAAIGLAVAAWRRAGGRSGPGRTGSGNAAARVSDDGMTKTSSAADRAGSAADTAQLGDESDDDRLRVRAHPYRSSAVVPQRSRRCSSVGPLCCTLTEGQIGGQAREVLRVQGPVRELHVRADR